VQWVRSRQGGKMARRRFAPDGAQLLHGFRQSVLLAGKSCHEASAANLSAGLQAAETIEQIAPRRQACLAFEQPVEDNSIAREQLPRIQLYSVYWNGVVGGGGIA